MRDFMIFLMDGFQLSVFSVLGETQAKNFEGLRGRDPNLKISLRTLKT
jgi:hypothetical protein